jgi:alkyl sulfatase BDS1-like metallo-beta-lactamase superfamily hydrolase
VGERRPVAPLSRGVVMHGCCPGFDQDCKELQAPGRATAATLALLAAIAAANGQQPAAAVAETPPPATTHTIGANRTRLPTTRGMTPSDFLNARIDRAATGRRCDPSRGRQGRQRPLQVEVHRGDQVPDTVNPSLWRISRLLRSSGLSK